MLLWLALLPVLLPVSELPDGGVAFDPDSGCVSVTGCGGGGEDAPESMTVHSLDRACTI